MNEKAIQALQELSENAGKRSKIGIIRELMPYIEAAMAQGVTLADIHAALTEKGGINIKYITFLGSYKRIKKENKSRKQNISNNLTKENKLFNNVEPNDTINSADDLSHLTPKQRRDKLGEQYIESNSNSLRRLMDKMEKKE